MIDQWAHILYDHVGEGAFAETEADNQVLLVRFIRKIQDFNCVFNSRKEILMKPIQPSEITPEHVYLSRREFLKSMGIVSGTAALLAACRGEIPGSPTQEQTAATILSTDMTTPNAGTSADELGDPLNSFEDITNYNNYYEFSTDKAAVARLAEGYPTSPWEIQVGGLVNKPRTFSLDDLRAFEIEERIYRLRCVEAWSMVIPWQGFPLNKLLKEFEPQAEAKYVRFETI